MTAAAEASPFVGPRPFLPGERDLFFGRDRETDELTSLTIAHPTVLLYAVSGAGKTSLLSAGVEPSLAEQGFDVLPRVRFRLPIEPPDDVRNTYIYAAIWCLTRRDSADQPAVDRAATLAGFLAEEPRSQDAYGFPSPRVLIFDQFEELFTVREERWHDREPFFEQVAAALAADPSLRVLFAMREEYLAQLGRYAPLVHDGLRTRLHLERLRRGAAKLAVEGPLQATGVAIEDGVADALVADLEQTRVDVGGGRTITVPGEFVEPVHLQVVCRTLWNRLDPGVTEVTARDVAALGSVDESLTQYYDEAVHAAAARAGTRAHRFREGFERAFITPAGTRSVVFAGTEHSRDLPAAALDELSDRHVIRAEWRAGARWLELAHDRLIEPIRRSNARFRDQRRRRLLATLGTAVLILGIAGGAVAAAVTFNAGSSGPAVRSAAPRLPLAAFDFDQDGRQEIVIGYPDAADRPGGPARGVVVITSQRDGAMPRTITERSLGLPPPSSGARFGAALASADFDDDGNSDLVIGAPGQGRVVVIQQPGTNQDKRVTVLPVVETGFGRALAAGDFNNDGFADLAIGASAGSSASADVEIVFGGRDGLRAIGQRLRPPRSNTVNFGALLSSGDLNGDGYADLVEGAPGRRGQGHASYCFGSPDGLRPCSPLDASGGGATSSLAVGDVTGDERDDVVQGDAGGGTAGAVTLRVGTPPMPHRSIEITQDSPGVVGNSQPGDQFGAAVQAGDVDGDGFADMVVGAPGADVDSGRVTVIRGGRQGYDATGSSAIEFERFRTGARLGAALALLRLTDPDRLDLVLTVPGADRLAASVRVVPQGIGSAPTPLQAPPAGFPYEAGSTIVLGSG